MDSKIFELYNKVQKAAASWYRTFKAEKSTAEEKAVAQKVSETLYAVAEEIRKTV